jgi:hemolysin activation/secretion protein
MSNIPHPLFRASHPFPACRLILFFFLLSLCSPSFSQPVPGALPGDQNLIQERQQRLLEEQQRRLEDLRRLPGDPQESVPAQPSQPGACVHIERIELEGADQLTEEKQRERLRPFEGQCLDNGKLNEVLSAITQAYLDRGLITSRAYLPAQDLSGGVLKIKVIEGRLEGFESSGVPSPREIRMSFPGKVGDVLNVRELEQMLDQLGRLPSRSATLDLIPGTEPGLSKITIKNVPQKSWRAGVRFDNSGLESTGERQLGAYLVWDSPLGLADQLSLSAGRDAHGLDSRRSNNQSVYYSVPFGGWTFNYSYSRSGYRTQTELGGADLKSHGNSQQHRLRAERRLHRDSVSKTSAALGLSQFRAENYFEDVLLNVSSYHLAELEFALNHGRRIGNTFVNIEAGLQRGIGELGAQSRGRPQGSVPDARYKKYSLTLSALHPFAIGRENFSFESLATGQKSEDALYSPQRIGLGGLSSVRGFKDQILYGNTGGYWRNQLRWRKEVPLTAHLNSLGVALVYDLGAVQGNATQGEDSAQLSGAGIELSAQGKYLFASLTYARTLTRPKGWQREHPVYFSLSLTY